MYVRLPKSGDHAIAASFSRSDIYKKNLVFLMIYYGIKLASATNKIGGRELFLDGSPLQWPEEITAEDQRHQFRL
jgi:hypothetical protein